MPHPAPIVISVPNIDTMTDRTVRELALHPNGRARSSHLSSGPSGQMWAEPMGDKIGRRTGLGTQVDD
jgi:hypothetical protein